MLNIWLFWLHLLFSHSNTNKIEEKLNQRHWAVTQKQLLAVTLYDTIIQYFLNPRIMYKSSFFSSFLIRKVKMITQTKKNHQLIIRMIFWSWIYNIYIYIYNSSSWCKRRLVLEIVKAGNKRACMPPVFHQIILNMYFDREQYVCKIALHWHWPMGIVCLAQLQQKTGKW